MSFVASQGTEQRLTDLDLGKLKKSSSDLENMKKSSELEKLKRSSSSEVEKFKSKERDLPSEVCQLGGETELSNGLELVKRQNKFLRPDQNSNCKSAENCAECVL